jgi:hypothetical protein
LKSNEDSTTQLVWAQLSMTRAKLMMVRANELRNKCIVTLELDKGSQDWLVEWLDTSYELGESVIQNRIEIMEAALAKYVSDRLDKANGER